MDISKLDPSKVSLRSIYGELTPVSRERRTRTPSEITALMARYREKTEKVDRAA
jgi:hypothetical protein